MFLKISFLILIISNLEIVNPHYPKKKCGVCHVKIPKSREDALSSLKMDVDSLCLYCHTHKGIPKPIHISGVYPDTINIPQEFPLYNKRITCITCHNEIHGDPPQMRLRGGPYNDRNDMCFKCHHNASLLKVQPHKQITEEGKVDSSKCRFCHLKFEKGKKPGMRLNAGLRCLLCHYDRYHPAGYNHITLPDSEMVKRIKEFEKKYNVILPLNPEGMIVCYTCHNPHEKGVLEEKSPESKGAS